MTLQRQRQTERQSSAARTSPGSVRVNEQHLAPYNSYGSPDFVTRGTYEDRLFPCAECGKAEIWRAAQQKWWYEVMKGFVYSTAKLCRGCRRREQSRRTEARRMHLTGIERKRRQGT